MSSVNQNNITVLQERLANLLGHYLVKQEMQSSDALLFTVKKDNFDKVVELIAFNDDLKAQFMTLVAVDERNEKQHFAIYAEFLLVAYPVLLTLKIELPEFDLHYPAMTPILPAANWYEREIHDLFGLHPDGMELDPLVLHRDWPRGKYFPLRKDFPMDKQIPIAEVPHQFQQPHAEGMHQIAVGPIHAGIIEPGHLRFCATGEQIHTFDAQLFYTHKGIEKMAEGKTLEEGLTLAEHVCGLCAFSHSVSFALAVESVADVTLPERAVFLRTILLELERVSNHLADLAAICSAGGLAFASVHAARFREQFVQVCQELTGHRFLRGINALGGLKRDIPEQSLLELRSLLRHFQGEFKQWQDLVTHCDSLLDRLEFAGLLTPEQATSLGLVGPAARGSGVDRDLRRDYPYLAYKQFQPEVALHEDGDVFARASVRIAEVHQSIALIIRLINELPDGEVQVDFGKTLPAYVPMRGMVESAKGDMVHWLMLDGDQRIYRWRVRSASYMNWRGMATATMGNNIVPDAPLVNKSFNLCYACVDR